jgi:hypothetical protein
MQVKMNCKYDENGLAVTLRLTPEQMESLGWKVGDNILPSLTPEKDIRLVNQHFQIRTTSEQLRELQAADMDSPELAGTSGFKKA